MPRKEEWRCQSDVCIGYLSSTPWEDEIWVWWGGMVLVDLGGC